ncbi:MAG: hypothetical protein ACRYGK_14840, partial [Janthinobacterium lividum]
MDDGARPVAASSASATAATAAAKPAAGSPAIASGVQTTKERRFLFGLLTPYRPEIQQGNFVSE